MGAPLSAIIVDDSALMRNLISRMLISDLDITVLATAMNGKFALEKMKKYDPDVIILDLEMPVMNGIDFLKEKKKIGNKIPVIILSSIAKKGAKVTMDAIALGASDFILKPSGTAYSNIEKVHQDLIQLVKIYGQKYRISKRAGYLDEIKKEEKYTAVTKIIPDLQIKEKSIDIIALGISTGGPKALREIFSKLDESISVPILVVQHMPPGFTAELAKSLNKICPLGVKEAEDGDILKNGRILIAPGDRHLEIQKKSLAKVVMLTDTDPVNGHKPSIDVLFSSVSKIYDNNCMAIIMTGMGKDGVKMIGEINKNGGLTVAQDEYSCVVAGMPKSAVKAGYIQLVVPLDKMAETINGFMFEKVK